MTYIQERRVKIVYTILIVFGAYGFVSNDDYHKMFDKFDPVMYNCDIVMQEWQPHVPRKVINECSELMMKEHIRAKTYQN